MPATLQDTIKTLESSGFEVAATEINSAAMLRKLLTQLPADTMVWPNAYYTVENDGSLVWIQELLEEYGVPYVGTGADGLKKMLDKAQTHWFLQKAGVPIPANLSINRSNIEDFETLVNESNLSWPIVVKPSAESCSEGVMKVNNMEEAFAQVRTILNNYPNSNAMLETFLPSEDVTCGFFQLKDEILLFPTYYQSLKRPGKDYVVERDLGVPPWSGPDIVMPPVTDRRILDQLSIDMPVLVQAMGIEGVTRVDARIDEQGILRYFDINGMPGLSYPKSVLVRQVYECIPDLPGPQVHAYLLNTIVLMAADRFNMEIPASLYQKTLFHLKGGNAIRLSMAGEAT